MWKRLRQKWGVNSTRLFYILCVFAITGTTTAFITKQITSWLGLDVSSAIYWIVKLFVLIIGYQLLILIVAIPFGQFRFFWNYEKKLLKWMAKNLGIYH
jgi:hypothetical protein